MLVFSIVVLAWLTLQWGILPRIDQARAPIEARASAALGLPVSIGAIRVSPDLWAPQLEFDTVVLHDRAGHEALHLPHVRAVLTPGSLLPRSWLPLSLADWQPHLQRLDIEGARLELRRDAQGRLTLAGFAVDATGPSDGAWADWLLAQGEVVVSGSALDWIDESRGAAALTLRDVALRLRNGWSEHTLQASATPPAEWGQPIVVDGRFGRPLAARAGGARAGDWRHWSGNLDLRAALLDLAPLAAHAALPFDLRSGRGAVSARIDFTRGMPTQVGADLVLRALDLRLAPRVEPLRLDSLSGHLQASMAADTPDAALRLEARSLAFRTREGVVWPAGDMSLALSGAAVPVAASAPAVAASAVPNGDASLFARLADRLRAGAPVGSFHAQRLDLAALARIAANLPLSPRLQKLVDELRPAGVVEPVDLRWQADAGAVGGLRYAAKGAARGLTLQALPVSAADAAAVAGRPGLRRADVSFDATESGGSARLKIDHGALEFPGVFESPVVALDRFAGDIGWQVQARAGQRPAVTVQVARASFANADLEGELNGQWRTGPGAGRGHGGYLPGQLTLDAKLGRAEARAVWRYLPLQLGETPRRYVRDAVQAGSARNLVARVDGDLSDFPFAGARANAARPPLAVAAASGGAPGVFRLVAQFEGVTIEAVPRGTDGARWPLFTDAAGELVFDGGGMALRDLRGRLGRLGSGRFELSQVNGRIADLAHAPQLEIEGQGRGSLADGLRYLAESPVGGWLHGTLAAAQADGAADLRLGLTIPLERPEKTQVKGSVTLAGNDLRLDPDWPALQAARGRIDFNEDGFAIVGGRARVLDGEVAFDGGFQGEAPLRIKAQGSSGTAALGEWLGPQARPWLAALRGQAAWRGELSLVGGRPQLLLQSDLVGIASSLPAPLAKRADEALPLRLQSRAAAPGRDDWQLALGERVQAQAAIDVSGAQPRWIAAVASIGSARRELPALPARGVALDVELPQFSFDAWQRLVEAPGAAPAGGAADLAVQAVLRTPELGVAGRRLNQVVARASRAAGGSAPWQVELQSQQAAGRINLQPGDAANPGGRVQARFARLSVARGEGDPAETLLGEAPGAAPAPLPALDIVVDDFELRGKRLGRLEIEAANRVAPGGAAREWTLSKLSLALPEATFSAVGQWSGAAPAGAGAAPRSRTTLTFRLDLADSGALLTRLGQPKTLRGGKGRMTGQLSWLGSPLAFNYPSLAGTMNLDVEAGQFLKADPGFAKLLGVLSLQSLPRRLLLDFRDVFQEGFSFDSVTGDVVVAEGDARTRNLRMRGVQAVVLMEGVADLAHETQDLRAWVVPEINAGTASLAYAVINPLIGLGTFIGQLFLRKPLAEANTREFHITGSWSEPQVYEVQHAGGAPVAEAATSAPPTVAPESTR